MKKRNIIEYCTGYLYLLPILIMVGTFILFPSIRSITLSFFKWPGYGEMEFVGLQNYIKMFTADRYFYGAFIHTFLFTFIATAGTVIIGFLMALFIDLKFPLWKTYRFVFFLPVTFSAVAVALLMTRIVGPNGLISNVLSVVGLESLEVSWLGKELALITISFIIVWQFSGFTMIFFLAGLKNISVELYDAAIVDGASTIRRIISITIPLLKNVFAVVILVQLIFSFKAFAIFWVMTQGGPAGATEVLGTYIYRNAFNRGLMGYSSVAAVVVIVVAITFSLIYASVLGYRRKK